MDDKEAFVAMLVAKPVTLGAFNQNWIEYSSMVDGPNDFNYNYFRIKEDFYLVEKSLLVKKGQVLRVALNNESNELHADDITVHK